MKRAFVPGVLSFIFASKKHDTCYVLVQKKSEENSGVDTQEMREPQYPEFEAKHPSLAPTSFMLLSL